MGNLSEINLLVFLEYLFFKPEEVISDEQNILLQNLTKSLTSKNLNPYSSTNKLIAFILYINSKIQPKKSNSQIALSKISIWVFLRYLSIKNGENLPYDLTPLLQVLTELSKLSNNKNSISFFSASNIDPDDKLIKWKCSVIQKEKPEVSFYRSLNNENMYSFINKLKATFIYIQSKIKRKKYLTVWFNSWRFEDEDELWAAFALHFMEQLSKQLSWRLQQLAKIKLIWLRLKLKWKDDRLVLINILLRVIFFLIVLVLSVEFILYIPRIMEIFFQYATFANNLSSFTPTGTSSSVSSLTDQTHFLLNLIYSQNTTVFADNQFKTFINVVLMLVAIIGLLKETLPFFKELINFVENPFDFSKIISNPNYKEHISFIEHFHADFSKIIKSYAEDSRVYVFIDDLDRCEISKAAELMQAINLMISDDANIYFVIGMDRKVIAAGVAERNKNVLPYLGVKGLDYGYVSIEKFIQLPFKVPTPKDEHLCFFFNSDDKTKTSSKKGKSSDNFFDKLFENLRNSFKNWLSGEHIVIETNSFYQNLMRNDYDCDETSEEFRQIKQIVASALERNPRRIKQFSNLFLFYKMIGDKTGLFHYEKGKSNWNCIKLAKFVAISIKWPHLISDLNYNITLLEKLQEYAVPEIKEKKPTKDMEPEGEMKPEGDTKLERDKDFENWIEDKKLIKLLRDGCVKSSKLSDSYDEYTLLGLNFCQLLDISPEVMSSNSANEVIAQMDFIDIPKGTFKIGSEEGEDHEKPVQEVTIMHPFEMGQYLVTQKQWIVVMGYNPSQFKGENRPVESISWNEVQEFILKINIIDVTHTYRLPSEAEWEYACRAGTETRFSFGDDDNKLDDYAWYKGNSNVTHPVGLKEPNPWGLYDMYGNVFEWCQDKWHDNYNGIPLNGSAWENGDSSRRVRRGGACNRGAKRCRSTSRDGYESEDGSDYLGFRLVREI